MNLWGAIIAGTLALPAAAPLMGQTEAAGNKKPNCLFIITDDHADAPTIISAAGADTPENTPGGKGTPTPKLDASCSSSL